MAKVLKEVKFSSAKLNMLTTVLSHINAIASRHLEFECLFLDTKDITMFPNESGIIQVKLVPDNTPLTDILITKMFNHFMEVYLEGVKAAHRNLYNELRI